MARPPEVAGALLTVDLGNSTLDCLEHASGARLRLAGHAVDAAGLAEFVLRHRVRCCVAASVVADGMKPVENLLASLGVSVLLAGRDLPCPLPLDYATPATLGVDRWLGALAAHRRFGRAVVVDCGSATTVNLVESDGLFRGGAIAPGLRAFAAGMLSVTPALPSARLDGAPSLPPRSTQEAVDTGVLLGYCGLVERLASEMLRTARGPAEMVITGGNAAVVTQHSRLRATVVDDLVHQGLRCLGEDRWCAN